MDVPVKDEEDDVLVRTRGSVLEKQEPEPHDGTSTSSWENWPAIFGQLWGWTRESLKC